MTTVLVVDDRAANREVARDALDEGGYDVIEASDGRQALQLARSQHPDVVLTDMLMPGIDGYQFAQEMRDDPETTGIPLIFYTANYSQAEVRPLAEAVGVSRIVEKTAPPQELLDAIAESLRESPAAEARPRGTQATQHIGVLNAKLLEKTGALDESEARFAAMAEASPVGIIITDRHGRATYVNPGARQITGWPDDGLLGTGWLSCLGIGPGDLTTVDGEWRAGGDRRDCRLAHPDGRDRRLTLLARSIVDGEGEVTGSVVTVDDVTAMVEAEERRRLDDLDRASEARRQATARFESLARLAGGVAHDFNNLLNIILSFGDFVDESLDDAENAVLTRDRSDGIRHDVDRIRQAGRRAADLTHQLLTFGGKEVIKPALVDLNAVVREVVDQAPTPVGGTVAVSTNLAGDLSPVKSDAGQLHQALINLVTNALEAMGPGGRLDITTENTTGTSAPGGSERLVHLSITDTGDGMSPEILDQAMEPFFTTKPKGAGPGLGLATSYGIVRQSGGRLVLESEPGRGTTAHLYLPAARPAAGPPAPEAGRTSPAGRTILVAEDEPGLREVILRILRKDGFHVLVAANGREAATMAGQYEGPLDAVLTDVVMPVMNGRELAADLAVSRPGTPILFMSGYAEPLMNEQGLIETDAAVLNKPFTRDELLAAVQRTLAAIAS
ncbi:ATP-binding response regulator [Paractinoplanes globisporus]|uniref:histidine kinase n=1 Tax=Paractinoplanes globisporus TaxID=113565 RepID=A0ABW6WAB2_9ACTN|nr:response regulator [Actinoplanes globisporus]